MTHLRTFARFWWTFVVGDDWLVAAAVAVAVGLTFLLTHEGINAWWLLPVAVAIALAESLRRAVTRS